MRPIRPSSIAILADAAGGDRAVALTPAFASAPTGKAFTGQVALYSDASGAGSCSFYGHLGLAGLDLDDHRQDHRPPLEALVDELRDVVVEVVLEEVDLRDLLLGRVRE